MYTSNMIKKGQEVKGKVLKVERQRILVDLNMFTEGVLYLEHFSRLHPVDDFRKIFEVGDTITTIVTSVRNDEIQQILLSKLSFENQVIAEDLKKAFEENQSVEVIVKQINKFGVILGYHNLELFLPFSHLDRKYIKNGEIVIKKGEKLIVDIIEYNDTNPNRVKITASRKAIIASERALLLENEEKAKQSELDSINIGDIKEGTVIKIDKGSALVKFTNIIGQLRVGQASHDFIENLADFIKTNDKVVVKVINKEKNRLDLSMKALVDTPYQVYAQNHRVGEVVNAKVIEKMPFGVLFELDKNIKGLLHKNEYSWNGKTNYDNYLKLGDEVELLIIGIDAIRNKISLSKKQLEQNPWKNVFVKKGEILEVEITAIDPQIGLIVNVSGVDAVIPLKELSTQVKGPINEIYSLGDKVKAVVTHFDKTKWELELSIKKVEERAERDAFEKYLKTEEQAEQKGTLADIIDFDELKNK